MKTQRAMKTSLAILLTTGLQVSALLASNSGMLASITPPSIPPCPECIALSPKIPMEATFAETTELDLYPDLVPVVPMEAGFEEEADPCLEGETLAPKVPAQADFQDAL